MARKIKKASSKKTKATKKKSTRAKKTKTKKEVKKSELDIVRVHNMVCPFCGSTELIWDRKRGEVICKKCGAVIEENMIDYQQEWREFSESSGESRRRTGSPLSEAKYDFGTSTKVGHAADLSKLTASQRRKATRMETWQKRISTASERNMKAAMGELKRAASALHLPNIVINEAADIYRKAAAKELVRGRSMPSVVAGAIYAACRRNSIPRTLDEIAEAFPGLTKKDIGKTYRFICRELNIKILPTSPLDYIHRFGSELGVSQKTITKAVEIMKEAEKKEITSGKGPMGIAAAALYIAALLEGEKKTQREVAEVAGVTEVTIRNRYKELIEKLKLGEKLKKLKELE